MNALDTQHLFKTYSSGKTALNDVSFSVHEGEIFALLGPNGAGKTTLISIVSGIVKKTSGQVTVFGNDIESHWRITRSFIGLVPQELTLNPFDSVWETLTFQRGFYGRPKDDKRINEILDLLALADKKDALIRELSGGMKRRVLIGKALTNEPKLLFLDEPSAGVDVELRQSMWDAIETLREKGTTIILTTHYLEEAEKMADRVGIIHNGKLELVEETSKLVRTMGEKSLLLKLSRAMRTLPDALTPFNASLGENGRTISFSYGANDGGMMKFLDTVRALGIEYTSLETQQKSLEVIFMDFIKTKKSETPTSS